MRPCGDYGSTIAWFFVDEIQSHFFPLGIMSVQELIPLKMVRAGQFGRIEELVGDAEHIHRLEEMGLRRGADFEVVKSGTPCVVRIGGCKLCIRDADSFGVLVRPGVAE